MPGHGSNLCGAQSIRTGFVVAGCVDDTAIVGHQEDPQWIEEVFKYVRAWKTAGIVMDIHDCWQVGFSTENTLLEVADVWNHVTPLHEKGQATCSADLQLVPSYARHFVLRRGDHCIHMSSTDIPKLPLEGHLLLAG